VFLLDRCGNLGLAFMRRRDFIGGVSGAAAAWPFATRAEQSALPLVGLLSARSPSESAGVVAGFRQGLREVGFDEERNVAITYRWAEGHYDRLPALADDLVRRRVAVIFAAGGPPAAFAAKTATTTIPVVIVSSDPVRLGLVASLARPGGNITGVSLFAPTIWGKQLDLLKQVLPKARVIAVLINPTNPNAAIYANEAAAAGRVLGIEVPVLKASTGEGLAQAFASLAKLGAGGLVVPAEGYFDSRRDRVVALSAQHSIAGCYPWREYAVTGGLMSYGNNLPHAYRQAGNYVGRILKGEKPADLPVVQPTTFDFVVNLKTAKALGLTIPASLLALADDVIE
jgi:putative ABC transport system substrate-binding protein